MRYGVSFAALAAVCAAVAAAPAAADEEPAPPVSGVSQYVEELPTAQGGTVPGTAKPKARKLPAPVQKKVVEQGGEDATALEQIATSSAYGAPQSQIQAAPPPAPTPQPPAVQQPPPAPTPQPPAVQQPPPPPAPKVQARPKPAPAVAPPPQPSAPPVTRVQGEDTEQPPARAALRPVAAEAAASESGGYGFAALALALAGASAVVGGLAWRARGRSGFRQSR